MNTMAYADLAADLRQLRGAISETAQTGKELGGLVNTSEAPSQGLSATESVTLQTGVNEGDILRANLPILNYS